MQTIALPATAEELAECVRAAHIESLALTPWGATLRRVSSSRSG